MPKLTDSAILLALISAILFSCSTAHFNGFLTEVNLDVDMMERSFHQVIYEGLILFLTLPVFQILILISGAWVFYARVVLPEYIIYVRKNYSIKRKIVTFKVFWRSKHVASNIEKRELKRSNNLGAYTLSAILFLGLLAFFEIKGKNQAKEILSQHFNIENNTYNIIRVPIIRVRVAII